MSGSPTRGRKLKDLEAPKDYDAIMREAEALQAIAAEKRRMRPIPSLPPSCVLFQFLTLKRHYGVHFCICHHGVPSSTTIVSRLLEREASKEKETQKEFDLNQARKVKLQSLSELDTLQACRVSDPDMELSPIGGAHESSLTEKERTEASSLRQKLEEEVTAILSRSLLQLRRVPFPLLFFFFFFNKTPLPAASAERKKKP